LKKLSKGLVPFSWKIQVLLNARFLGTEAEELKWCVASFLFPLPWQH